jgi:D-arabinose 1-dehydrogenase-like Zn-dependent alcohol dehydrogenase
MSITTIHAYAVRHQGGRVEPFSYDRQLGNNEVLVNVTHCSIAKGDVQFIDNDWGDTRFPCFVAQPLEPLSISVGLLYDNAQRTIYGNYVGSRKAMMAMLAFAAEHNIHSTVEIRPRPFTEVNEAIDMVRRGTAPMRVVLQR